MSRVLFWINTANVLQCSFSVRLQGAVRGLSPVHADLPVRLAGYVDIAEVSGVELRVRSPE